MSINIDGALLFDWLKNRYFPLHVPVKLKTGYILNQSLSAREEVEFLSGSGKGFVFGVHHRVYGAESLMERRIYIDGETTPSIKLADMIDGMGYWWPNANTILKPTIGYHTEDNISYHYIMFPFAPPKFNSSVSLKLYNSLGASFNASAFGIIGLVISDFGDFPAVGNVKAIHEHDTSIGANSTVTLLDTGTGVKGRFRAAFVELDHVDEDGANFELRIYHDGEASPSIKLTHNLMKSLFGDSPQTGFDAYGCGSENTSRAAFGFYFSPGQLGICSYFKDRLKVEVYNPSGQAGDVDWCIIYETF